MNVPKLTDIIEERKQKFVEKFIAKLWSCEVVCYSQTLINVVLSVFSSNMFLWFYFLFLVCVCVCVRVCLCVRLGWLYLYCCVLAK